ncbi:alpha/beta hydrolase [Herbidospora mongoliensis]|uniref:alpha/beta hydrolase n=1 Tax=Herbidospora mongoliensis TaxID=688067 RepID=UPI000833D7CF|nr:alpha/beta hydrolase-fold protein [Herbidospora mongoliensis]
MADRLDVWTYELDGELETNYHFDVTDEERAAAGRETVVQHQRALIPANKARAAENWAGKLPPEAEIRRVWTPRDPAELRARLGDDELIAWDEDDVLHVVWRGVGDQPRLGSGMQFALWPVEGADDLWEASVRIRRLDEAVITVSVGTLESFVEREWRGPKAPPALDEATVLEGVVEQHELPFLGESRQIFLYLPPKIEGLIPAVCLADGQMLPSFARTVDAAIMAGTCPPVAIVGVASPPHASDDPRSRDYLPSQDPGRYAAHLAFITDEVLPWADERFPASDTWLTAGVSSGAVWALNAAQRRPDVFSGVIGLSPGIHPETELHALTRAYLGAGTLESGFRWATGEWATKLTAAGAEVRHVDWVGGHDVYWWARHFPLALTWLTVRPE